MVRYELSRVQHNVILDHSPECEQSECIEGSYKGSKMKLKISINLLLFTSAIAHASPIIINSINLKVGETQRIELRSNPTTGYSWYPTKKIEKNPIITLVKSGYEADNTGLVGSGGSTILGNSGQKGWILYPYTSI